MGIRPGFFPTDAYITGMKGTGRFSAALTVIAGIGCRSQPSAGKHHTNGTPVLPSSPYFGLVRSGVCKELFGTFHSREI